MHPAPSVIFFSTLSGMGFGLLAFLGIGMPVVFGWEAFAYYFVAYALAVGGLLFSAFHLANPKNAWKAFSQWKSSWLSREAWMSVLALIVMGLYAAAEIFLGQRFPWLGYLGAAMSLFTVFTTSMIYTQLKTVPRWNHPTTPLLFLLYSITGGALLSGNAMLAFVLLLATGAVQLLAWSMADGRFRARGHTIETATGLGFMGKVRQFEPPHTGTNYLLDEMVYRIGRKHAKLLRAIAVVFAAVLPALLISFAVLGEGGAPLMLVAAAAVLHLIGIFAQRWLFFAEAEHVVGLYYDKR